MTYICRGADSVYCKFIGIGVRLVDYLAHIVFHIVFYIIIHIVQGCGVSSFVRSRESELINFDRLRAGVGENGFFF